MRTNNTYMCIVHTDRMESARLIDSSCVQFRNIETEFSFDSIQLFQSFCSGMYGWFFFVFVCVANIRSTVDINFLFVQPFPYFIVECSAEVWRRSRPVDTRIICEGSTHRTFVDDIRNEQQVQGIFQVNCRRTSLSES